MKNYINLTPAQRNKAINIIRSFFYQYMDDNVVDITERLMNEFVDTFGGNEDMFYNTFDKYKDLREVYQMLSYHHNLYKQGVTRKDMFSRLCGSYYFDGGID